MEITPKEASILLAAINAISVQGADIEQWAELKAKLKAAIPPKEEVKKAA